MKLVFLKASIPLTKTFTKTPQGIEKSSYPNVYEVTSIEEDATTLKDFASLISKHAAEGHCLLKGFIDRPLISQSRAGSTNPNAESTWALLDVDGMPMKTPNEFMKALGLGDVSYTVQYSASHGIVDPGMLRCHIFVLLDKPYAAPILKQHLIALNFKIDKLKEALTLTKTGNSLRYGLDITTCQNDKLIYIADPVCKGFKPPVAKRVEFVKKKQDVWAPGDPPSVVANKALIEAWIAVLRENAGLPKRKNVYKMVKDVEILKAPDQCIVTGIKEERGFVYFNLNGGDSWAYYHPANNPDFIHNFKGESVYLTNELLPDYWQQVCRERRTSKPSVAPTVGGQVFLAFLDRRSSSYWRGTFDQAADRLELYLAKNETQVQHFARQNGFALPDYIPEWEVTFDPHATYKVDIENQRINTFEATQYMKAKASWSAKKKKTFPTIQKVIHHALGSKDDVTERFINWVAAIAQRLDRTRTAWVLHGTTGTGKGLLMNNILTPLFGYNQVATKRMDDIAEPYNAWMERTFIVFVDEVQTSILRNEKGVIAKLKNFITEPTISVRAMYQNSYAAQNRTNWIFASNMPDPVMVDMNDRRMNVARYQNERLEITQEEIDSIPHELQAFWDYLKAYAVDFDKAATPMDTEDRQNLMRISEASIDSVSNALLSGDLEFFIDQLPTGVVTNMVMLDLVENYKHTLIRIIDRNEEWGVKISRDELRAIYEYAVGDMPKSPNKFTARLKHHRIHTTRMRVGNDITYGIEVKWREVPADAKARLIGKPQAVPTGKKEKTA